MSQPTMHVFGMDVPLSHILLVFSMTAFFLLLIKWHYTKKSRFDLTDAFLDQRTNRASFDAIVTSVCVILAVWWVVTETLAGNKEVGGKLVDILMIFVIYRGAKQAINAYQDKPPSPVIVPTSGDNIAQQVKVEAPDAPDVPQVLEKVQRKARP